MYGVHRDNIDHNLSSTTATGSLHGTAISSLGCREMKTLYRGVELLSRNQPSAFLGREKRTWATRMSYGEALLSLRLTTQAGVKESMMPGTFCLFAQKGRNLRPPVY